METIRVDLGERGYDICISNDLACLMERIMTLTAGRRVLSISDDTVYSLYGEKLMEYFRENKQEAYSYSIPAGEASKNLETVRRIYRVLLKEQFTRKDMIIAFGGGVVGDTAGFAASTYYRGIGFIQLPTTLLSQVDSSVGGKVGVNFNMVKNAIGSFYQPKLVCIAPQLLKTLDGRQIRNGMAEIIVHSVIASRELFSYLEENMENILSCREAAMEHVIAANCRIKRDVVLQDEYDKGKRAILNFGHTIGHAVEACSNYTLLHGEAVSIGMVGAAKLAVYLKMLSLEEYERIKSLLVKSGLPITVRGISAEEIYIKMLSDKKRDMDRFRFVLPGEIGRVSIVEYNNKDVIYQILNQLTE